MTKDDKSLLVEACGAYINKYGPPRPSWREDIFKRRAKLKAMEETKNSLTNKSHG